MRRLNCAHSQLGRAEIVARLESRGIPVYVDSVSAFRNPGRGAIFVCLDAQYADAVALLRNEDHIVADPVDVEAFWKKAPGTLPAILNASLAVLVLVAVLWLLLAAARWLSP